MQGICLNLYRDKFLINIFLLSFVILLNDYFKTFVVSIRPCVEIHTVRENLLTTLKLLTKEISNQLLIIVRYYKIMNKYQCLGYNVVLFMGFQE